MPLKQLVTEKKDKIWNTNCPDPLNPQYAFLGKFLTGVIKIQVKHIFSLV